jgi:hypothetical protein
MACGWSSLRTARAVTRITPFLAPPLQELPSMSLRRGEEAVDNRLSP